MDIITKSLYILFACSLAGAIYLLIKDKLDKLLQRKQEGAEGYLPSASISKKIAVESGVIEEHTFTYASTSDAKVKKGIQELMLMSIAYDKERKKDDNKKNPIVD